MKWCLERCAGSSVKLTRKCYSYTAVIQLILREGNLHMNIECTGNISSTTYQDLMSPAVWKCENGFYLKSKELFLHIQSKDSMLSEVIFLSPGEFFKLIPKVRTTYLHQKTRSYCTAK